MRHEPMKRTRKYSVYEKENPPKNEMVRYLLSVDGILIERVIDLKSRPVGMRKDRRGVYDDIPYLSMSARRSNTSGGILEKGIQLHRYWFEYLKLALDLESLGNEVRIVTRGFNNHITDLTNLAISDAEKWSLKQQGLDYNERTGQPPLYFASNETVRIVVNRKKYEGWDLDRVLSERFNQWWSGHDDWDGNLDDAEKRGHAYLFEGHYPKLMTSKDDWSDDPRFLYVRIDRSSKKPDVDAFLQEEIKDKLSRKGNPSFVIDGRPRPDQLQNRFNALVLSLTRVSNRTGQPLTDKEICEHDPIYLRSPLEISKTDNDRRKPRNVWKDQRTQDPNRLTVPVDRKTGKPRYSILVAGQRRDGIHHLIDVLDGQFGSAPSK